MFYPWPWYLAANLITLSWTHWSSLLGGWDGVGASFGSTLAVLAHISLSRPCLVCACGGGGVLIKKHVKKCVRHAQPQSTYATKKCQDEMRRDSSFHKLWLIAKGFSWAICLWNDRIHERNGIRWFWGQKLSVKWIFMSPYGRMDAWHRGKPACKAMEMTRFSQFHWRDLYIHSAA